MDWCKDLCLIMINSGRFITNLDIDSFLAGCNSTQFSQLHQLSLDLKAGAVKLTNKLKSPRNDPEHMQILRCFTSLVTALVIKLDVLRPMLWNYSIKHSSSGKKRDNCSIVFNHLWFLLYTACQSIQVLPHTWPQKQPAEYASFRGLMERLLTFILRFTRSPGNMFSLVADVCSDKEHGYINTILSVPFIYMSCISKWQHSEAVNELTALPPGFISLMCCTVLEQINENPSVAELAEEARVQAVSESRTRKVYSFNQNLIKLGAVVYNLCVVTGGGEGGLLHVFATPAVTQLFKRILLVSPSLPHADPQLQGSRMSFLTKLIPLGLLLSNQAKQGSGSYVLTCPNLGEHLSPMHKPVNSSSDTELLRVLLKGIQAGGDLVEQRYSLVNVLMESWHNKERDVALFPPLSSHDEARACHFAAHHCAAVVGSWMRHQGHVRTQQQHKDQQQSKECTISNNPQQDSCSQVVSSEFCTPSHHAITVGFQQLIRKVFTSSSIATCIDSGDVAKGRSGIRLTLSPPSVQDTTLQVLQKFYHMPGSLAMLEASMRCAIPKKDATHLYGVASAVAWSISRSICVLDVGNTAAFFSLASSLQKVLRSFCLQPVLQLEKQQQQDHQPSSKHRHHQLQQDQPSRRDHQQQQQQRDVHVDEWLLKKLPVLLADLLRSILVVDNARLASFSSAPNLHSPHCSSVSSHTLASHEMHRVESVMVVCWMLICHARIGAEVNIRKNSSSKHMPGWLKNMMCEITDLLPPSLVDIVHTLVVWAEQPSVKGQAQMDRLWEKYALSHFDGRLVSGCCYLGCTNLSSVSEAALKTKLCGGCRKARYCSTECQKAAWLKGRHRNICRHSDGKA